MSDEKRNPLEGNPQNYRKIVVLVTAAFIIEALILLCLNARGVASTMASLFGSKVAFLLQLFFWAALGATIASSMFLRSDAELNELERLKESPDPKVLRYPNDIDVWLYAQRILTSGFLGVIGSSLFIAGLWYFDLPLDEFGPKHKLFLAIVSFLVGLYQGKFLTAVSSFSQKLFQQRINS